MKPTRRRLLAGVAAVSLLPNEGKAFLLRGGGSRASGGGTTLATITLVNDSGSTSVAGTPTQSFGCIFKKGDIPSGTAPQFQVSGVTQPFSASVASMRRYHTDGSLLFCAFSLRPTFTIAGSGSQAVTVLSGGSWPSASSRSLTEVRSQSLHVSTPAASPSGANLSGTWGAWLTTANASNLITTGAMAAVMDMDGDAGARWRLSYKMSQTEGGAAHGQLVFDFYIHAMNNSSGGLGGFRWCGYARQPFYNLAGEGTTVPAKNFRAFATPDYTTPTNGPNWTASGVSATPMGWKGGDNNPMVATACTVVGGQAQTTAANNFWFGAAANGQPVPGYFTGTLPTGINANTVYFCLFHSGSNNFDIYTSTDTSNNTAGLGGLVSVSGGGAFSFHPVPVVCQFTRQGFKDDNGRYLFFQGTGTGITAESTLRVRIDRSYWVSTGLIPPYDYPTYKSTADGGTITDSGFSNLWNPLTICTIAQFEGAAGDHVDIGHFPNEAVLDFFNQSVKSERATRCFAEASCLTPYDFRDASTGSIVNLSANTYTGLPASNSTTYSNLQQRGDIRNGYTAPPTGALGLADTSGEHKPQYACWAWLRFGELQYWDFLCEQANTGLLSVNPANRNMQTPSVIVGTPLGYDNEYRMCGWYFRDIGLAALFGPYDPNNPTNTAPDGTQSTKYFIDCVTRTMQRVKDIFDPANSYFGAATTYFTGGTTAANAGRKILAFYDDFTPRPNGLWMVNNPQWEYSFVVGGYLWADALSDANASYLLDTAAQCWNYYIDNYGTAAGAHGGGWNLYAYYNGWGVDTTGNHAGHPLITRDQDQSITPNSLGGSLDWTNTLTAGTAFLFNGITWENSYTPSNGDFFGFSSPPAGLSANTGYYVVGYNSGTNRFGLSNTNDGASTANAIMPSSAGSGSPSQSFISVNANGALAPQNDFANRDAVFALNAEAPLQIRMAACWAKARKTAGGTYTGNFDTIIADADRRLANAPNSLVGGTGWPLVQNYTSTSDVRYVVRSNF